MSMKNAVDDVLESVMGEIPRNECAECLAAARSAASESTRIVNEAMLEIEKLREQLRVYAAKLRYAQECMLDAASETKAAQAALASARERAKKLEAALAWQIHEHKCCADHPDFGSAVFAAEVERSES